MNEIHLNDIENELFLKIKVGIDLILNNYSAMKLDFNNDGVEIENFVEFQKNWAINNLYNPSQRDILKYINSSLENCGFDNKNLEEFIFDYVQAQSKVKFSGLLDQLG